MLSIDGPVQLERYDYHLLNAQEWQILSAWYGNDVTIPRTVISRGSLSHLTLVVETYPPVFHVYAWASGAEAPTRINMIMLSSGMQIRDAENKLFDIIEEEKALESPRSTWRICYGREDTGPWKPLELTADRKFRMTMASLNIEQQEESFSILLVEEKSKEHENYMTQIHANRWRYALELNQRIDAQDTEKTWYEAKIIDLNETRVKVHYMGWTSKWDAWHDRTALTLAPLHSEVTNWRDFRVNDRVEYAVKVEGRSFPNWRMAKVIVVDGDKNMVKVRPSGGGDDEWHDIQGETLCAPGTHKHLTTTSDIPSLTFASSASTTSWGRSSTRGRP